MRLPVMLRTLIAMHVTQSGGSDLTKKTAPGLLYAVHTRPRLGEGV
jgi:hypothetical protein